MNQAAFTIEPFPPPLLRLRLASEGGAVELLLDPRLPVMSLRNGAPTFLVCLCGTRYISSQRQTALLRSCYHLHCPNCGRAISLPRPLWEQLTHVGRADIQSTASG